MISKLYFGGVLVVIGFSSSCNLFYKLKNLKTDVTKAHTKSASPDVKMGEVPKYDFTKSVMYGIFFPLLPYTIYKNPGTMNRIMDSRLNFNNRVSERFYLYGTQYFDVI